MQTPDHIILTAVAYSVTKGTTPQVTQRTAEWVTANWSELTQALRKNITVLLHKKISEETLSPDWKTALDQGRGEFGNPPH